MSTETTTDVRGITRITRDTDARAVARAAYDQLLGLLRQLEPAHWDAPTDCEAWHVADMVRHLAGAAKGCASVPELVRQQVWGALHAREYDGNALDATNDLQVEDHAHLSPGQLVALLVQRAPKAVAGRLRTPGLVRRVDVTVADSGSSVGMPATLNLGHLMDAVYTRDVWLHSIDIERATGVPVDRRGEPDARIVEDVVAEWAARHGEPFELTLTGPAGGRYRQGTGGEHLELDAIEFCRSVSRSLRSRRSVGRGSSPRPARRSQGAASGGFRRR